MKSQQPTIKIQIPEPCSQSWDEMTPEAGGRHCISCAKTVVDFTRMTDAQILEVMRFSAGGCGRFRNDQVNRELIAPPAEKRFSITAFYKLAAGLLLVFSAGKVTAQKYTEIHAQIKTPQNIKGDSIVITGFVKDENGEPLTAASIQVESYNLHATAGIDGEFELAIPNNLLEISPLSIVTRYVGYASDHIIISQTSITPVLYIVLKRPNKNSQEDVTMGILVTVSKPKKWWQFWKSH